MAGNPDQSPDATPESALRRALARRVAGDLKGAADACRDILAAEPGHVAALHLLGLVLGETGLADRAADMLGRAAALDGDDADLLFNLGVALRAARRTDEAVAAFRRAAELAPADARAWFNLGNLRLEQGHAEDALDAFERAAAADGGDGLVHNNAGVALRRLGREEEAAARFRRAVALLPGHAGAHDNLGNALFALGRHAEAVTAFGEAIRLEPGYAEAHYNLGNAYRRMAQFEAAAICYRTALGIDGGNDDARAGLGHVLQRLGRLDAAADALAPLAGTGAPAALADLANVYRDQGRFDEALALLDRALAGAPGDARLLGDRALALEQAGRMADALEAHAAALAAAPGDERIASNRAQALLAAERWAEGWAAFEARLDHPEFAARLAALPGAPWAGEKLHGMTILVATEQGLGDAIQFARYLSVLAGKGARVMLAAPKRMAALLATAPGVDAVVDEAAPPAADYHAPLLSLPHLLKMAAPLNMGAPYLAAEPARAAAWREGLGGGLKVGLVWRGNPAYERDHARSLANAALAPLANVGGVRFIDLNGPGGAPPPWVESLGPAVDADGAFADTAAAMTGLDLVISTDTAIAHLAGALGRPVWMLTAFAPDWRWARRGPAGETTSPWYPSLRMIRQRTLPGWEDTVAEAARLLAGWAAAGGDPNAYFDREVG